MTRSPGAVLLGNLPIRAAYRSREPRPGFKRRFASILGGKSLKIGSNCRGPGCRREANAIRLSKRYDYGVEAGGRPEQRLCKRPGRRRPRLDAAKIGYESSGLPVSFLSFT